MFPLSVCVPSVDTYRFLICCCAHVLLTGITEDAVRHDIAAHAFGVVALCAPFRQVALAGLCLPFLWLILFDLGGFWQMLSEHCLFDVGLSLRTSVHNMCAKTTINLSTIRSQWQTIEPTSFKSRPTL